MKKRELLLILKKLTALVSFDAVHRCSSSCSSSLIVPIILPFLVAMIFTRGSQLQPLT